MLNGIFIGIVIGLVVAWRLHVWWAKSSIKKATDAVGAAAKKPAQLAKGLHHGLRGLYERLFGHKEKKS